MNIIEAIKSGKRFRRSNQLKDWYQASNTYANDRSISNLLQSDILADDWEIEEEKIEITKAQLKVAVNYALIHMTGLRPIHETIAKELGFKE